MQWAQKKTLQAGVTAGVCPVILASVYNGMKIINFSF